MCKELANEWCQKEKDFEQEILMLRNLNLDLQLSNRELKLQNKNLNIDVKNLTEKMNFPSFVVMPDVSIFYKIIKCSLFI